MQTELTGLNRYLKYLFKEAAVTAAERREKITAEIVARTGITEPLIE